MAETRSELAESLFPAGRFSPAYGTHPGSDRTAPSGPPTHSPMGAELAQAETARGQQPSKLGSAREEMAYDEMPESARTYDSKQVPAARASYTVEGPWPFVCANCYWFDGARKCKKVQGPYGGGAVKPEDTCRFFLARNDEGDTDARERDAEAGEPERDDDVGEPSGRAAADEDGGAAGGTGEPLPRGSVPSKRG